MILFTNVCYVITACIYSLKKKKKKIGNVAIRFEKLKSIIFLFLFIYRFSI